ncbi:solute carrier organic anion transporter family member 74D isoform X1 [Procambarus clarkii]|uniref:solute carrier organic anion transporter family member 74D isoform X1 n=2 Tax=Procambarus clarkii TaxID=6728 RepID=UPI00374492C7
MTGRPVKWGCWTKTKVMAGEDEEPVGAIEEGTPGQCDQLLGSRRQELAEIQWKFTEQDLKDTECGLGPCRARWLQRLALKECLIAVFSLSAIVQGMFFSYTVAVISTIEKRFQLTSKQTGIMLAGNDISVVMLAIFLGYYGNAGHRPRWLGVGIALTAISSFMATLPHFIYGTDTHHYLTTASLNDTAQPGTNEELCLSQWEEVCEDISEQGEGKPYIGPIILLFVSQFIVGISMTIYFTVGISYVDDNINKKTTAFYYSIYLLLRTLGPVLGFMLGGKCLSFWINPTIQPSLSHDDPRWLGAWWIGFLIIGGSLLPLGCTMVLFPRKLPATLRREAKRTLNRRLDQDRGTREAGAVLEGRMLQVGTTILQDGTIHEDGALQDGTIHEGGVLQDGTIHEDGALQEDGMMQARPLHEDGMMQARRLQEDEMMQTRPLQEDEAVFVASTAKTNETSLKNLPRRLRRLLRNRIYTGNLFNMTLTVLATSGYKIFQPKYLEHQFKKTAAEASYYTGMATMVATTLGTVVSAVVLRWVRPRAKLVIGYNVFSTLLTCVCYLCLMFIGCPEVTIITPTNMRFLNESDGEPCWSECGCSERFSPVCAEDLSTVYYSPCYAGCSSVNTSVSDNVYGDCRCIESNMATDDNGPLQETPILPQIESRWGSAIQGYCPDSCNTFIYYILIQIFMDGAFSLGKIGSVLAYLRAVADEDKGLAIGIVEVSLALFGFIPAPVIMGAIIDSSCVIWNISCGKSGNCWLYDLNKLRVITHLVPAGIVFVSVLGDLVMYYYSDTLDLYGEKDTKMTW